MWGNFIRVLAKLSNNKQQPLYSKPSNAKIKKDEVLIETKQPLSSKKIATYLIKNGEVYYFCKRIDGKIIKFSLKTKELNIALYRRDLILKMNMKELQELNKNRSFTVEFNKDGFKIEKSNEKEDDELILKAAERLAKEYIGNKQPTTTAQRITIKEIYDKFVEHKKTTKDLRPNTLKNYNVFYTMLLKNVNENEPIENLDNSFVRMAMNDLKLARRLNNNTINKFLKTLKMFLEYSFKNEYILKVRYYVALAQRFKF